jgi:hypothetical protein
MWRRTEDIVLKPWRKIRPSKALVITDGGVVACEDDSRGEPHHEDVRRACNRPEEVVASLGIATNGLATAYSYQCDLGWLAERLKDYDPALASSERRPLRVRSRSVRVIVVAGAEAAANRSWACWADHHPPCGLSGEAVG